MGSHGRKRIRGNPGAGSVRATRLKATAEARKDQRAFQIFAVFCCAVCVCIMLFRHWSPIPNHDFDGSKPMWDMAQVRQLFPERSNFRGQPFPPAAYVDFKDGVYRVDIIKGFAELQVGKEAVIKYRRGKSGAIVVDFLQPATYRIPMENSGQTWVGRFP